MTGGDALIRAGQMANACACGDRVDAGLILLARMAERLVQGALQGDEVKAWVRVMGS